LEYDEPTDQQIESIEDQPLSLDNFPPEIEDVEGEVIAEAFQLLEDALCFETANMILYPGDLISRRFDIQEI